MKQQQTRELTVRQAGAIGGTTTRLRYGRDHFRAIGKKGQAKLASKINSDQRRIWGRMGGRPRKRLYSDMGGE